MSTPVNTHNTAQSTFTVSGLEGEACSQLAHVRASREGQGISEGGMESGLATHNVEGALTESPVDNNNLEHGDWV